MQRDKQRSKVYAAERSCSWWCTKEEMTLEEIADYLAKLQRSAWFKRRWPHRTVPVYLKDGRGRRKAGGGFGKMTMPRWSRNEPVVLHEFSHVIAGAGAWHDWRFASTYLELVTHCLGKEAGKELRAAFKKHRVKYNPPRQHVKREVSPETLARLVEGRARRARLLEIRRQRDQEWKMMMTNG